MFNYQQNNLWISAVLMNFVQIPTSNAPKKVLGVLCSTFFLTPLIKIHEESYITFLSFFTKYTFLLTFIDNIKIY